VAHERERRVLESEHELVDQLDGEPDHDEPVDVGATGA